MATQTKVEFTIVSVHASEDEEPLPVTRVFRVGFDSLEMADSALSMMAIETGCTSYEELRG